MTTFQFDPTGRLTNTIHPDGLSVTNHYFVTGLPKKTAGARTYPVAYTHDHAGRMKTMMTWTDATSGAGSAVTTWNYDGARGWLTNKVYADGKGPSYTNTAAGRLAFRNWARGTNTTYTYNNAGELSGVDYSDPATPDVTYVYDRLGRQTTNVQGSITTTRAYDLPGNLLSEKYSGGPLNGLIVSNNYDGYFRRITNGLYNGTSWLVLNGYAYDASNRLSVVTDRTNSATYAYLANSSLIESITFKENGNTRMVTAKAYDNLNRLTAIVSSNSSAVVLASFQYAHNLANQRTAVTNADSTRWGFGYDFLGQVNSGKKYWSDASVIAGQQFEYGFDDIGNREFAASGGNEWGTGLRYQHYTANNLNQYTQRTVPGGVDVLGAAHSNATVTVNLQPTYRKGEYFRGEITTDNSTAARWLSLTNVGVLANITPTITNDILSTNIGQAFIPKTPEAFAHDKDGNLITNGQWLLTWDTENRLSSAETLTSVTNSGVPRQKLVFAYDAQSRRTSKIVSNWVSGAWQLGYEQRFAYDGWNPNAIVSSSGTVIQSLLWGLDLSGTLQGAGGVGGLLVVNDATNGAHFCAYDGNGNVSALASTTDGSETARYEYGPFGELLRTSGLMATVNSFLFSTEFHDWETALYYYGYRYYDPVTGRWPNRDPIAENGGLNLYGFAANAPVNSVDVYVLGLAGAVCCFDECKKVGEIQITKAGHIILPEDIRPDQWEAILETVEAIDTAQIIAGKLKVNYQNVYVSRIRDLFNQALNSTMQRSFVKLYTTIEYRRCEKVTCIPAVWASRLKWEKRSSGPRLYSVGAMELGYAGFDEANSHSADAINAHVLEIFKDWYF